MDIKLVIWDWNGTLLNDVDYSVEIINQVLLKHNLIKIDLELYRKIFTFPVKKYYENLGFDFSKNSFEEIGMEFIDQYNKNVGNCQLQDGAIEILSKIKNSSIKQVVISAREHTSLLKDIHQFEISNYFNTISGISDNYASSKLHLFQEIIEIFGFENNEIVLIGDTIHDYEISQTLKIKFIYYSKGHQDQSHFVGKNNIIEIKELKEILDIISFSEQ